MNNAVRIGGLIVLAAAIGIGVWLSRDDNATADEPREAGRVAVEVAPVTSGDIRDVRELTGNLEAQNAFTVAASISGRIERIHADIGDRVERGSVLVEIDDDEARQAVAEAEAALAVARAERDQAISDAELAQREFERTRTLAERDLASQSELDAARAEAAAERSRVAVTEARVSEREAALAGARVRLSYTEVRASWPPGDGEYVVGARMVSRGDTVGANDALLALLSIDPLQAVVFAAERDYAALERGQAATVVADALPGREFAGEIARLAPRFDPASRQARVEIRLPNAARALNPGMFARVYIEVGRAQDATLVPVEAVTRHDGERGVYRVVDGEDGARARFVPVTTGIEGNDHVEIVAPDLAGRVVTLGLQLLEDDSPILIADERSR